MRRRANSRSGPRPRSSGSVLGFSAKGAVTAKDYESTIIPAVEELFDRQSKVRFLYWLGEDFRGFEAAALWDDAKLGFKHFSGLEKMAIVTNAEWIRIAIKVFGLAMQGEVRVFKNSEMEQARQWVIQ